MAENDLPVGRRPFLSSFGVGAATLGVGLAALAPSRSQAAAGDFEPARHEADDWLDGLPGRHRMVIDSSSAAGGGSALLYASNFFAANKAGYDLDPPDLAIVVVLRHFSTAFAYTDAIWAKYGTVFSEMTNFTDPKTGGAPVTNLYNAPDYGRSLQNFGNTIASLVERNVQFAVCNMATRVIAGAVAEQAGEEADAVYQELASNLIPNSRLVAAGIIATSRAQERGYTFLFAG